MGPMGRGIEVREAEPLAFIVAEVSKNWPEKPGGKFSGQTINSLFEEVIEHNRRRGYVLHSFQLHRVMTSVPPDPPVMNETIVAVFRHKSAPAV
jgi:hypothetical protein